MKKLLTVFKNQLDRNEYIDVLLVISSKVKCTSPI